MNFGCVLAGAVQRCTGQQCCLLVPSSRGVRCFLWGRYHCHRPCCCCKCLKGLLALQRVNLALLLVAGYSEGFDSAAHAGLGVPPLEVPQLAPPKKALPDWLRQEMLKRGIGLNAQAGE